MTKIQWTDVPGWPGVAVTRDGAIRGPSGKVLAPYVAPSGHLHVLIRRRKLRVHHAVLLAFVGPPAPGEETRHLNGRPADNRVENLAWGTRLEQREDDRRNGVSRRPSITRLSADQVAVIRHALAGGAGVRTTARALGVSHTTVIAVRDGRLWKAA